LPKEKELLGPKNDVQAIHRLLQRRGFEAKNIRVLADQVSASAGLPTREAIMRELKALTDRAGKDDFVFLYFAGHGSQQPAQNLGPANPEEDGLDEVFLPRDVTVSRDKERGVIPNGIVDNEWEEIITAIRRRGAFVWAVFDTCHSGTITRGVDDEGVRYRDVQPSALGVNQSMLDKAAADARKVFGAAASGSAKVALRPSASLGDGAGGLVVFSATQENERAKEERLPAGRLPRESMGVFSYALAQVLEMNPAASYRQVGQQVLQTFAAMNQMGQTPMFEGESLDAPLFGSRVGQQVRQWPIERQEGKLLIAAGNLHQIGEGAIFAALPDAVSPDDKALGYLQASSVGVFQSTLAPVAYNSKSAMSAVAADKVTTVRLVRANLSQSLRITLPPSPSGLPRSSSKAEIASCKAVSSGETLDAKARAVIQSIQGQKVVEGVRLEWTKPDLGGDIRLLIFDGKLWLLPAGGELICDGPLKTHSIDLTQSSNEIESKLVDGLRKIAKVINLLRLAGQTIASDIADKLKVDVSYVRGSDKPVPISVSRAPDLLDKDKLVISIENRHIRPVDLTVLVVDSEYGIGQVFPNPKFNETNRIQPNSTRRLGDDGSLIITTSTVGREQLMFIAVEGTSSEPVRFDFLAQTSVARTRGTEATTKGADEGSRELVSALFDLGFNAHTTRGVGVSTPVVGKTLIRFVPFNVLPKAR